MRNRIVGILVCALVSVAVSACSNNPAEPSCTITIPDIAVGRTVEAAGGTTLVQVQASRQDCAWSASTSDSWLTVSPTSGSGSAAVTVTTTRNPGSSERSGLVYVATNSLSFRQPGAVPAAKVPPTGTTASCNYNTLTPNYAEELQVFSQPRYRQYMNSEVLTVWLDPRMDENRIGSGVRLGLQSWSVATNGQIGRIQYIDDRASADIDVYFADPGVVASDALAEGRSFGSIVAVAAYIRFSFNFFLDAQCSGSGCARTAQIVAAHEMGHVLAFTEAGVGVEGHTSRTDSIMQNRSWKSLPALPTSADINTMRIAYGCP